MNFDHIKQHTIYNTPDFVIERYLKAQTRVNDEQIRSLCSDLVVLDCETTGISFSKDKLTQIAAARVKDGEIVDWYITFIDPGIDIPEDIVNLTGINNNDVKGAPTAEDAISKLVDFIGDSWVVAHNAEFDRHFITSVTTGYPLINNLWVDTLQLTRIALPRAKSHRLADLIEAFGGPIPTHRADDDVVATVHLLKILIAAIWEMPLALIREITNLTTIDEWETVCFFKAIWEYKEQYESRKEGVSRETFNLKELRRSRIGHLFRTENKSDVEDGRDDNKELKIPSEDEIIEAFKEHGLLDKVFDNFSYRQEQVDMALAIRENFIRKGNLVVEAGTGVGKSMAYLLVAAYIAKMNNVSIGISTKTNSLLDQLTYKDLPQLNKCLDEKIRYTALKGISHYPCLRKIERLEKKGGERKRFGDTIVNTAPAIATILSYVEQSEIDDIDMIRMDYRCLKTSEVTSTYHECHGKRCPYYRKLCFAHGAREIAQSCDIVVTNHSMVLVDRATSGHILPKIEHWVIDEAHSFESIARKTFAATITEFDLKTITEKVSSTRGDTTCVFHQLEKKFNHVDSSNLFYALFNKCVNSGDKLAEATINYAERLRNLDSLDKTPKSSFETEDIWIDDYIRSGEVFKECESSAMQFVGGALKCSLAISDMVAFLDKFSDLIYHQAELVRLNYEINDAIEATRRVFKQTIGRDYAYFTIARRTKRVPYSLSSEYLNIGKELGLKFYSMLETCVFTSATLKVDNSFNYFEEGLALSQGTNIFDSDIERQTILSNHDESLYEELPKAVLRRINKPTFELTIGSSFNYDANMTVYVPTDIAEPGRPGKSDNLEYLNHLQEMIVSAIRSLGGSMLVLFTSRSDMENCYKACEEELREDGLKIVCQTKGVSTKRIADEFIANESVSMFALKSFWEGFDAPGDTLRGVLVAKLPFAIPTDPLNLERKQRDNCDVFRKYCIPKVALEMKQAVGRLIRNSSDKGIVIITDKRVLKNYGRQILTSMPTEDVRLVPRCEISESIRRNV